MKPTIPNPKVFISYAWGDDIHQEKVRSFATSLIKSGIDVVLDQWNLEEGNDTYKFMDKSVNDPTITNVLILLDENYTNKANERKGGVGTETQIITPELYNKADQTKFIPIIFERKDGKIFRPAFLKALKYVDLSQEGTYESNLKYLTKILFGIKIHKKPELGLMPDWVIQEEDLPIEKFLKLNFLKDSSITNAEKTQKIKQIFADVLTKFSSHEFSVKYDKGKIDAESYFNAYKTLSICKKEIFNVVSQIHFVSNLSEILSDFFENIYNCVAKDRNSHSELKHIFIHEIFLNILGHLYKIEDFSSIGHILTRTYLLQRYGNVNHSSFSNFYCTEFQNLDSAINEVNQSRKITAIGDYWLSNIDLEFCNREDLIFVDLLLNIFSQTKIINNLEIYWFPKLYIYDEYHKGINGFAAKLKSKNSALKMLKMFNLSSIEIFKVHFKNLVDFANDKEYKMYGYSESFSSIPLLANYIKVEEIGMYN